MNKKLYHYTTIENLYKIITDGTIKLATAGLDKGEKPGVWFSTNPFWESTVNKLVYLPDGSVRQLNFKEMKTIGIARIEVELSNYIVPFSKFFFQCNMKKKTFKSLIKSGRAMGAIPQEWYASLSPIKRDYWIDIEIMSEGKWIKFQ